MGRTLPSANIVFMMEEEKLSVFRKLLSRTDRLALDQLFDSAHKHVAEASYAASPFPMQMFLVAMVLEDHKIVMDMRKEIIDRQSKRK